MKACVPPALASKVVAYIDATKSHSTCADETDSDLALFLDVDMSILGKPPARTCACACTCVQTGVAPWRVSRRCRREMCRVCVVGCSIAWCATVALLRVGVDDC